MKHFIALVGVVCAFAFLPINTGAQSIEQLGEFNAWRAFRFQEGGSRVCYMASQPVKSEGDYTKRGQVFWLVTHRPALQRLNVSSFVAGYPFEKGSTVTVAFDQGNHMTMFTKDETSWLRDEDDIPAITKMKRGLKMVITGVSQRGTKTLDTFSLSGFTAAYNTISRSCNVD